MITKLNGYLKDGNFQVLYIMKTKIIRWND